MNEYPKETLLLAALLHDLGKFWQRAEPKADVTHQEYGRRFVDHEMQEYFSPLSPDLGLAIAEHHSETPATRIQRLLRIADSLSMQEGSSETEIIISSQWEPLSALLTCQPVAETPQARRRIRLKALTLQGTDLLPQHLHPDDATNYSALWKKFMAEFAGFASGRVFEPADLITILSLLHKYTSCMPAQTVVYADSLDQGQPSLGTSLFLHLKTTAAIAACLDQQLEDDEADAIGANARDFGASQLCALVKGDISGTQDFIYLLTSSGAARGLRARSFYLQLLTETIAHWILRQIGLAETNLLFAGGGHFYMLLPYVKTEQLIGTWRKRISQKLWKAHQGDLYLNLGFVPVTYGEFLETDASGTNNFAAKWSEVTGKVSSHKFTKWLETAAEMQGFLFTPQERGGVESDLCAICQFEGIIEIDENDTRKCERCRAFEQLGKELRNPDYMVAFECEDTALPQNPTWQDTLAAFGTRVMLELPPANANANGSRATVWRFDSTEFLDESDFSANSWDASPRRRSFRLLAGATPTKLNEDSNEVAIAEFGDLARASDGAKWFGVLRMDVDSLGEVFKKRLGAKANIAHMSTMSESLRLFFESRVPQICRQRNLFSQNAGSGQDKIFLLYAGGDDLFVAGAWSELPHLAEEIRDEFCQYVGGGHLTLSAGIAIEHEKYPLYQLANDAKSALEDHAKGYVRSPGGRKKDAICFLQTTVGWENFPKLANWQQRLVVMIEGENGKPKLPRGFLTRLGQIHFMFAENRKRKLTLLRAGGDLQDIQNMIYYERWRWQLTYQLGRLVDRYPEYRATIEDLQTQLIEQKLIDNLNAIARWAELLTRKE